VGDAAQSLLAGRMSCNHRDGRVRDVRRAIDLADSLVVVALLEVRLKLEVDEIGFSEHEIGWSLVELRAIYKQASSTLSTPHSIRREADNLCVDNGVLFQVHDFIF
jgi:hypothetical protein